MIDEKRCHNSSTSSTSEIQYPVDEKNSLYNFYLHLGALVIRGKEALDEQKTESWVKKLSTAGYQKIASLYENLLLIQNNPTLFREGLGNILTETGQELRDKSLPSPTRKPQQLETELNQHSQRLPLAARVIGFTTKHGLNGEEEEAVTYLTHMLNAGTLKHKREAAKALGLFIKKRMEPALKHLREEAAKILAENKDPEITFDIHMALAHLHGSEGKKARAKIEHIKKFLKELHAQVVSYWNGEAEREPIEELSSPELVELGIWTRLACDYLVGHIEEVLLRKLTEGKDTQLSNLLSALVYSADARLLPVFIRIAQDGAPAVRIEAIKCIAHIDDPRAMASLEKAFRHTELMLEKIHIARGLLKMGVRKYEKYLVETLALKDKIQKEILIEALKALEGSFESNEQTANIIRGYLESNDIQISRAAARAISGVGGESDIEVLNKAADKNVKLKRAAKSAAQFLYSHIILRGIEMKGSPTSSRTQAIRSKRISLKSRIGAWLYFVASLILLFFNKKTTKYIDRAILLNPFNPDYHFLKAKFLHSAGQLEAAIESLKEGIMLDPLYIIKRPEAGDELILIYLEASITIEKQTGSPYEALILLEELSEFDLSRCDPNVKIELERRLDYLKYTKKLELEEEKSARFISNR